MAVIIEEERPKVNLPAALSWGIVLIIIVAAVYYIFVRRPDIVDVSIPPHLQNTQRISQIKLNPETITNNPKLQSRRKFVEPPVPGNLGRENPFIPL